MSAQCGELRLRNGVVIADPLTDALSFIRSDGTYQGYDAVASDPWDLSEVDLHLANRMIARMGRAEWAAVLSRRDQVRAALEPVPVSASLAEPADKVPWDSLRRLYASLDDLPGIGLARATKILHKKRPALVPILDEVVVRYLRSVSRLLGPRLTRTGRMDRDLVVSVAGSQALELTRAYHDELQGVLRVLSCVQAELGRRGYGLTECRLLDIYLWAYSSTYEPLWRRREGLPPGHQHATPTENPEDPLAGPGASAGGAAEFWADDAAYLDWLSSHPEGFVLNCEHQPKARYLKLHRSCCHWLHIPDVKSWTKPYMKVCATNMSALDQWAASRASASPDRCSTCKP
jgi:hypothetical protein